MGTRTNAQPVGYRPQIGAGNGLGARRLYNKNKMDLMRLIDKERGQIMRGKDGGIKENLEKMEMFDKYLSILNEGGPEADSLVKAWEAGELEGLWSGYAKQATPNMPPAWS